MSEIKDGGPAFPHAEFGGILGMSLRDYFAAKALNGLMASDGPDQDEVWEEICQEEGKEKIQLMAETSYRYADAMLKARES